MGEKSKHGFRVLCIPLLLLLASCGPQSSVTTLKLGHALDTGHAVHKGMMHMAERLDFYSNGSMKIEIYPSGQLGSERELVELLQIGSLAMTKVSSSPLESFVPEMKVFSLPYVFRDQAHYKSVLASDIGKSLLLAPEKVRLRGMGYYDAGSRSPYRYKNFCSLYASGSKSKRYRSERVYASMMSP